MSARDSGTEAHIKETAKRIFFREGRFGATTQEIADAAGVNRTLLHYYFRSRDILLEKVLLEGQIEFRQKLASEVEESLTFREKIGRFVEIWIAHTIQYPYLDAYLVSQMHDGNFLDQLLSHDKENAKRIERFLALVSAEMEEGRLQKMEPMQFLLNLISLLSYPIIMRPLLEKSLAVNKRAYNKLIADRKEVVLQCLFGR